MEKLAAEEMPLAALRDAAQAGFGALDAGAAKCFSSIEELESYLRTLSDEIIGKPCS